MRHALYLFVILPFLFFSCGDIVLEETEDTSTLPNDTNTSENPTDTLTVATLNEAKDSTKVVLRCYIVGYMSAMNASSPTFSAEDAVASNIVVADEPYPNQNASSLENELSRSSGNVSSASKDALFAAVQLPNNSAVRQGLNLQDHPELLHKCVLLTGIKMTYFRHPGLKPAKAFKILEDVPTPPSSDDDSSIPSNYPAFPTINENAEVFEGC